MAIDIKTIQSKAVAQRGKPETRFSIQAWLNRDISIFSSGFDDKKKEALYSKMNTLLAAGVDITTVLELVEEHQEKGSDKFLISNVRKAVISGSSLSQALLQSGKFSPFEYYSVQIGEETGMLNQVLADLALYFHNKISQKRKFVSAIAYPVVILLTAFGAVFFMMRFLVPLFADVYKRFGGELPFITKIVLGFSAIIAGWGVFVIVGFGVLGFILYQQRQKIWFRKLYSRLLINTPVFGAIIHKMYLSRFCNSMSLLIGANVPLTESLRMLKQMITFYPIEETIDPVKESIFHGETLHKSMAKHAIYPKELISLVKVGEEVNGLDKMFDRLSKQYTADIAYQTEILNSLLEPLLIVFIGIIIGFILVAMYLPIFKLSTQMM